MFKPKMRKPRVIRARKLARASTKRPRRGINLRRGRIY